MSQKDWDGHVILNCIAASLLAERWRLRTYGQPFEWFFFGAEQNEIPVQRWLRIGPEWISVAKSCARQARRFLNGGATKLFFGACSSAQALVIEHLRRCLERANDQAPALENLSQKLASRRMPWWEECTASIPHERAEATPTPKGLTCICEVDAHFRRQQHGSECSSFEVQGRVLLFMYKEWEFNQPMVLA